MTKLLSLVFAFAFTATAQAQSDETIRLNQTGMYPNQEKVAVIEAPKAGKITIRNAATGKTVAKAKVLRNATSPWSGKQRTLVDFSTLKTPGQYVLSANGHEQPFTIKENALREVTTAAIKSYYLMRSGCEIEEQYAGEYARPLGHADTRVMIHPSAATTERPAGSYIVSPLGWYDAGDFNKYIVNSAYSVAVMLLSYEQNPGYYDALNTNIPESKNQTADLLDELMYNLQWMLTMQDPNDGGVYHKLTTPNFEGFVMPKDCHQQRYVIQKSVTATYDFAAVMALAARIFKDSKDYPTFSRQATEAARQAYQWALQNPKALYNQNAMNKEFQPAVNTGTYGDFSAKDEQFWAATELYLLTKEGTFLTDVQSTVPGDFRVPAWGYVAPIAQWEWIIHSEANAELSGKMKTMMLAYCDKQLATTATSSFQTPTGNDAKEFGWGCLAEAFCANGMTYLFAHNVTGQQKYLTAAMQCADYILGRNATGYCYVTGFGLKSPMHPHQRISAADGIEAPMPGLLVGGPNPGQQDKMSSQLTYPSNEPDESYIDHEGSYASNEIAINWNATLVGLTGWLDNIMK